MTTDGGWSILYAATGANSEVILTSNDTVETATHSPSSTALKLTAKK